MNILYKDEQTPEATLSFIEVLDQMRDALKDKGYTQIPQLTSSKELNLNDKFDLVPDSFKGTRRAVMIGINYVGHNPGELVSLSCFVRSIAVIWISINMFLFPDDTSSLGATMM